MKLKSLAICTGLTLCTLTGVAGAVPGIAASAATAKRAVATPRFPVLNSGTVLFVDSHRIGATGNLRRDYVPGTKVRIPDRPVGQVDIKPVFKYRGADPGADAADGDTDVDSAYLLAANTVIREYVDGRLIYRMWLRSGTNVGYRESTDGLHWRIHDPASVIVATGVTGASVMKDPKSGLYYLLGWRRSPHAGYAEMVSRDGINFKPSLDFSGVLSQLMGDVIQANTDPGSAKLLAIAKQKTSNGTICRKTPEARSGGRTFGTNVSNTPSARDIRSSARYWSAPRAILTADCIDELSVPPVSGTIRPAHLYGLPFQRYGDQFVGFPWFFQVTKASLEVGKSGYTDGPVDTQIASTPDMLNVRWRRSDPVVKYGARMKRPSLIARGPSGSWDDGMLYGQNGLVAVGDRTGLYYTGWNSTHAPVAGRQARVGLATWRKDGFVGLKVINPRQRGWLRTRTFRLASTSGNRNLYVNAALASKQNLRVAVLDGRTGRVISGFRAADSTVVTGDQLSARVTWKGRRLGVLRSQAIRLLFSYGSGSLYSFRVA